MTQIEIQINQEIADNILLQSLQDSLDLLRMDIKRIQNNILPTSVAQQDLADMLSYEPAFVKVLQYYTARDEWHNI